ncbi:Trace amine-associated receptor 7e [Trichoplax sp. H2]|nr:Trace amine-associated receptor 7e [Trichoplax sp. H2]|eukprot:RDD41462.1 Trace amine-associated receptor 7e [Trichoplax sp. H2]
MASYVPCPDVHLFVRLNLTNILFRPLTSFETNVSITWSVLFGFILLTSCLILGLILLKSSLRTYSNAILASLCLANILYSFIYILPVKIVSIRNSLTSWINIYCQLGHSIFQFCFICCINFHICLMALEKLLAITRPTWHLRMSTMKIVSIIIMIVVIWVLPFFFGFFPLIIGWWRVCPNYCVLTTVLSNRRQSLVAWHIFLSFLTFLLPTSISVILYSRIVCVTRNNANKITENKNSETSGNPITKVVVAVSVIIGVYLLLQTPYNIFQIIYVTNPALIPRSTRPFIREWLVYAASWNCVTSPVIFAYYDQTLRQELINIITCRCYRSKSPSSAHAPTSNAVMMRSF